MSERKYIFELSEEEVKILAYGGMPKELKLKLQEIAEYINTKKRIEAVKSAQAKHKKIDLVNYIEKIRKEYPKAYAKWSDNDDIQLKKEFLNGKSPAELSKIFERQPGGIRSRLIKLSLIEINRNK